MFEQDDLVTASKEVLEERAMPRRTKDQVWRQIDALTKKIQREEELPKKLDLLAQLVHSASLLMISK